MVTAGHNHNQAIIVIGVETGSPADSEGIGAESELSGTNAIFTISVIVGLGSKIDTDSKVEVGSSVRLGGFDVAVGSWINAGGFVVAVGSWINTGGFVVAVGSWINAGGVAVLAGGISVGFGVGGSDVGVG